jgi:hypothetical protein
VGDGLIFEPEARGEDEAAGDCAPGLGQPASQIETGKAS